MLHEITTNAYYEDLIEWLQTNVGKLLWSRPIVEWKGRGLSINHLGGTSFRQDSYRYLVRIDDSRLATLAALRWSST